MSLADDMRAIAAHQLQLLAGQVESANVSLYVRLRLASEALRLAGQLERPIDPRQPHRDDVEDLSGSEVFQALETQLEQSEGRGEAS